MRSPTRAISVALSFFLFPVLAFAQGERGALTGTVTDPTGAIVPDATITVTEMRTGVTSTVKASSAGYYRLPVPPGTYKLECRKDGFKTGVAENIVVPVAQVVTIDFTLQVGSITESVTVTSEAPLLTPSTSEVGNSISPQEFTTLPLPIDDGSRQLMTFIYSSLPGAVGGSWNGSINGGQYFTTEILIEGLPLGRYDLQGAMGEVTPSADAASEFKVQMSGYSAEYGNTGGGVANFGMKSGTNEFHGTVYEYNTNPMFNATGYNINKLPPDDPGKVKPPIRENNFGGAIGGPIRKNKTFFFFTYEGNRLRAARPSVYRTLPTARMLDGDFSEWLGSQISTCGDEGNEPCFDALGRPVYASEIYDPTSTRQVYAGEPDPLHPTLIATQTGLVRDAFGFDPLTGLPIAGQANIIPQAYWSTASAQILPLFPAPINDNKTNNVLAYRSHPLLNSTKWTGKIDHVISDKHKMSGFFTYSFRHRLMGEGNRYWLPLPGYPLNRTKIQEIPARIFRLSEDWMINDHTLNHFAFGYNRFGNRNGMPAGEDWFPSTLGITGLEDFNFPRLRFSSASKLRDLGAWGYPGFNANESYIWQDTLSYVRGKHSFKFGAELIRYRMNTNDTGWQSGSFNFNEVETGLPGTLRKQTGHAFASFIMGAPDAGSRDVVTTAPGFRQGLLTFYFQDDWKATSKLTFNYGIRWDIPMARTEAFSRMSSFDPTVPNPGADDIPGALVFLGDCQGCTGRKSFQDSYYREVAPRLGFAYSATQKLVIRGGYGIAFSPPIANGWPGASAGFNSVVNFGNRSRYPTQFGNAADPVLYWTPLTAAPLPPGVQVGVPPFTGTLPDRSPDGMNGDYVEFHKKTLAQPYVQNWNFGFQYLLPAEILIEADYNASKGTRLIANNIGGYYNQADSKFLALGNYVSSGGDDILDMDVNDALADPIAGPALAALGFTQLPYPSFSGLVSQAIKRYPQYDSIGDQFANLGSSTYHSLQLVARKRAGHGLNFIAAYTWSKTLSNTDAALGGYYSGYSYAQDYYNQRLEKSIASFDYPHFLKLTWIYDLPFGRGKKWLSSSGALDKLFGGWRLTAIQQYFSGNPLEVYDSNLWSGIGAGGIRGDVIAGVDQKVPWQGPIDPNNGTPYLSPDAFAEPPYSQSGAYPLRVGTGPRFLPNTRGPWQQSEDFGILKDTRLSERFMLKFRADFFNVFNRTGRGDPETDIGQPDRFGRIFGVAHGARNIMLSLRLDF